MPSKKYKRKPRSKPWSNRNRWSMYPALHEDVTRLLAYDDLDLDFHPFDDSDTNTEEYDTCIMGQFTCPNDSCSSTGWTSKKIAITIRLYPGEEYNARVYHQRCKSCDALSRPVLDDSYAERVAYRIKKWHGVKMEKPPYSRGEHTGPHNSELCEGCKEGHCKEGGFGGW